MIDENVEKELLHAVEKEENREKCLLEGHSWPVLYHLSSIRENILDWYEFDSQASLLEIGAECGALTELFCRKVYRVVAVDSSEGDLRVNLARNKKYDNLTVISGNFYEAEIKETFDYVVWIGGFGYSGRFGSDGNPYIKMLKKARECLKPGGKFILAMENKYGVKYFAGAREKHTGRFFDGLENYAAAEDVRTFSRGTLEKMLTDAGFSYSEFYYPMPDYEFPSEIYSERCQPSFGSLRYPCVAYDDDRYELLDERLVFDSVCEDGMFRDFANSFLVISHNGDCMDSAVVYAKYNRERAPQFEISTRILEQKGMEKCVEKSALRPEAKQHIQNLSENRRKLVCLYEAQKKDNGAVGRIVPVQMNGNEDGRAVFPFVKGVSLAKEVQAVLGDRNRFLDAMHKAVDNIYGTLLASEECLLDFEITEAFERVFGSVSSEEAEVLAGKKSFKVSNIDCILSNFVKQADGSLVCLDYEWVFDFPIPVEYLIFRTVYYYYSENIHYIRIPEEEYLAEFGLTGEMVALVKKMDDQFQQYVHGKNRKYIYTSNYAKKSINLGKDMQAEENWFVSIVNDVHSLNGYLAGYDKELVTCHVKTERKGEKLDKWKGKIDKIKNILRHK